MERPTYNFDEFLSHIDALHRSNDLRDGSWEGNVIKVYQYLQTQYDNEDEARYKAGRLLLIMGFISEHIHELDKADYAVYGSKAVGAMVGQHVLRATFEIFTTSDLASLGHGPSVGQITELADKYRESEV